MKHHKFVDAAVVLAGVNAAREFLEPIFCERDQELVIAALCDSKLRILRLLSFPGSRDAVQISLSDLFRSGLDFAGIILAHNHPSGDLQPSEADIEFTRRLLLVTESLEVTLLDHLIFAGGSMFSFRKASLI